MYWEKVLKLIIEILKKLEGKSRTQRWEIEGKHER